ncbi:hypothetical protein CDAR_407601 [Caerostris darwini]|uniref:Uncharacterized protein n=1 Tax=Caerostris darwini TaxID=1538125 RepID=A0AAV4Q3M3_9ARAC|nr:hypothetical protein CDAR_407601 [Caerostris darwini]
MGQQMACTAEIACDTTFLVPGRGSITLVVSLIAATSPSKLPENLSRAIERCATEEKKPQPQASVFCEPSLYTWIHSSYGYLSAILAKVSDFKWGYGCVPLLQVDSWTVVCRGISAFSAMYCSLLKGSLLVSAIPYFSLFTTVLCRGVSWVSRRWSVFSPEVVRCSLGSLKKFQHCLVSTCSLWLNVRLKLKCCYWG